MGIGEMRRQEGPAYLGEPFRLAARTEIVGDA
jgi:hypothetical protein